MLLRKLHPVLKVRDVRRALKFYERSLGFEVAFFMDYYEPPPYAGVQRDGIELQLELVDDDEAALTPTHLRFLVDDPDALFQELSEQGAIEGLRPARVNGHWDTLELSMNDPDGNLLTFYRLLIPDELK